MFLCSSDNVRFLQDQTLWMFIVITIVFVIIMLIYLSYSRQPYIKIVSILIIVISLLIIFYNFSYMYGIYTIWIYILLLILLTAWCREQDNKLIILLLISGGFMFIFNCMKHDDNYIKMFSLTFIYVILLLFLYYMSL